MIIPTHPSYRHGNNIASAAATAAVSIATVVGLMVMMTRSRSSRRMETTKEKDVISLMPGETSSIMMDVATSISTVTFFTGDHRKAAVLLRHRLTAIIKANPWLCGKLDYRKNHPSSHKKKKRDNKDAAESPVVLVYDTVVTEANIEFVFTHLTNDNDDDTHPEQRHMLDLCRDGTPYEDMARTLHPVLVKNGTQSIGRPHEPQFKVTIIPDSKHPHERWALVVSLSHVIADGHTFYQIHNMLSDNDNDDDDELEEEDRGGATRTLNANRKPHIMNVAVPQLMRGLQNCGFLSRPKPGLLVSLVTSTIMGKIRGPSCAVGVFLLNHDYIAQEKKKVWNNMTNNNKEDNVQYVSTNDIITASMFQLSNCGLGTMDINFRGRLPTKSSEANDPNGLTDTDAGNYEDKIIYMPEDFTSPSLIRQSISSKDNVVRSTALPPNQRLHKGTTSPTAAAARTELPTSIRDFWKLNMITSVSNWSTFAKDIRLDSVGSSPDLHLPLFDPQAVPARMFTGSFVFRTSLSTTAKTPNNGSPLGLAIAANPDILETIAQSELVSGKIDMK